ncbi:Transposable element tcb1 transposase [Caligus rogercresseyi]|uniref:Transposable element tcb1 transposase n=1 Tax=Caligus rogercresseyi TaxID=217165 RepID=A0A7T8QTD3_CALRO|nr:Transposable element tcb1 transposase [Caligus rogercresseyi]
MLNLSQSVETSAGSSFFISDLMEAFRDSILLWCVTYTSLSTSLQVIVAWVQVGAVGGPCVEVPEVGHILLQPGLQSLAVWAGAESCWNVYGVSEATESIQGTTTGGPHASWRGLTWASPDWP